MSKDAEVKPEMRQPPPARAGGDLDPAKRPQSWSGWPIDMARAHRPRANPPPPTETKPERANKAGGSWPRLAFMLTSALVGITAYGFLH